MTDLFETDVPSVENLRIRASLFLLRLWFWATQIKHFPFPSCVLFIHLSAPQCLLTPQYLLNAYYAAATFSRWCCKCVLPQIIFPCLYEVWKISGSGLSALENYGRLKCMLEDGLSLSCLNPYSHFHPYPSQTFQCSFQYFEWEGAMILMYRQHSKKALLGKIFRLALHLVRG